jgi:hypothetical protein
LLLIIVIALGILGQDTIWNWMIQHQEENADIRTTEVQSIEKRLPNPLTLPEQAPNSVPADTTEETAIITPIPEAERLPAVATPVEADDEPEKEESVEAAAGPSEPSDSQALLTPPAPPEKKVTLPPPPVPAPAAKKQIPHKPKPRARLKKKPESPSKTSGWGTVKSITSQERNE